MKLLDSNIIIYSAEPENQFLRELIEDNCPFVSIISKIEVLGYHKIKPAEKDYFNTFFLNAPIIEINHNIIEKAISIRQAKKVSLGDSLIAATALIYDLELNTRNTDDFKNIEGLKLLNPFENTTPDIQ